MEAFNLTRFIYPLESKIKISSALNLALDNPRTEEEILFVDTLIRKSLNLENTSIDDIPKLLYLGDTFGITELKNYLAINENDSYAFKFFESHEDLSKTQILAKSWIILRFQDNGKFNNYINDILNLVDNMYNDEPDEYISNFTITLNYSYILSLLINNENLYGGSSFLLFDTPLEIFYHSDIRKNIIYRSVESFRSHSSILKHKNRAHYWSYWLDVRENLLETAEKLEYLVSQTDKLKPNKNNRNQKSKYESPQEKLLYIGSILKSVHNETINVKLKLLLLTSVLEYLVTRNPDTNKFNVEDSISKQFKLKCSILIYQNSTDLELNYIKEFLEKIYNQRSDIAHGNYNTKHDKKDYKNSVIVLYGFIKAVIFAYLNDQNLVDFLKDN